MGATTWTWNTERKSFSSWERTSAQPHDTAWTILYYPMWKHFRLFPSHCVFLPNLSCILFHTAVGPIFSFYLPLAPTVSSVPLSFPPLFLTLPVYTIFHLFLTTGAIELFSRNMECFWNTIFFRFTLKIISTWGGRVGTAGFFSEIFLDFCIQLRADIVSHCSCLFTVC